MAEILLKLALSTNQLINQSNLLSDFGIIDKRIVIDLISVYKHYS